MFVGGICIPILSKNGRPFWTNTDAISEEFTFLPALSIVIIGFIIAYLLIGQTYQTYQEQTGLLDSLESTEQLYQRIIQPSAPFIIQGGIIDYEELFSPSSIQFIQQIQQQYYETGLNFSLLVSFYNTSFWYPTTPCETTHRIAVSHLIGLEINSVETTKASLSVVVWKRQNEIGIGETK